MDEEFKNAEQSAQEPRKKLKKVKRPKRPGGMPYNDPLSSSGVDAFNLDTFLDESNLPAKTAFDKKSEHQFLNELEAEEDRELDAQPTVNRKVAALALVCTFFAGFLMAKIFFTQSTIVTDGLQGVVVNPEVPRGRARCGLAEKIQGCVLYIMNPQRQELSARDFYDLAAQLTGRQRFVIETGNMRYSNYKIKPGSIAQLNIPPLQ